MNLESQAADAPNPIQSRAAGALGRLEDNIGWAERNLRKIRIGGSISEVSSTHYRVAGLSRHARLGDCVRIEDGRHEQMGEIVRIDGTHVTVKPFDVRCDATIGARAYVKEPLVLWPSAGWKGRVIDALGRPIDGGGELEQGLDAMPFDAPPPPAMRRSRVKRHQRTGVRVIDCFTPICSGQRIGIFAGSGVGKSSLLAMLARAPDCSVVVIALVGERGREVREFLDDVLGESRKSAIAVVSTGDESPMMRRLAPKTAMTVAEYFRNRGEQVFLIVDSVTRFAHAARDVALVSGEPPVARGYPPSVFSELPRLLERAGPGVDGSGSITGVFSVLVDGDDQNDPVVDSIRGTLDGHVVLSRAIADQGRYPAMDMLASISRLASAVWTPDRAKLVANLRRLIARYEETRDLRLMGGYLAGSDPLLDQAIKIVPRMYEAMAQSISSPPSLDAFHEFGVLLAQEVANDETRPAVP